VTATAIPSRCDIPGRTRRLFLLLALGAGLVAAALLSLGTGAMALEPGPIATILLSRLGLAEPAGFSAAQEGVLVAIRLPRMILGALAGAGLAVAGALLQGLFRNPLADPGLIGVSGGAALAAASVIVLGEKLTSGIDLAIAVHVLPLAAFAGGLTTVLVVHRFAGRGGETSISGLLLAGIALNALAGGATGLLLFVATDAQLRSVTFWSLGSLGGATWTGLAGAAPLMLLAIALGPRLAGALNLLQLGESEAGHLGLEVERIKRRAITLAAMAVGAAVAVAGIIGFVGLVVPHLVRLIAGPDHRAVLPGSALLGATLLLSADVFARTVAAPAEVPIGIVTALFGAPFLLWLLRRRVRRSWT
jgi:iron complex transport system permease protein